MRVPRKLLSSTAIIASIISTFIMLMLLLVIFEFIQMDFSFNSMQIWVGVMIGISIVGATSARIVKKDVFFSELGIPIRLSLLTFFVGLLIFALY